MAWLVEHSLLLANAGFGVLLLAVALRLLRPVEPHKRLKNALKLLGVGVVALLIGCFGPYLRLSGMEVLLASGASLVVAAVFQLIQWSVECGKGKWRTVDRGVWVACGIGFALVLLSVVARNWP